MIPRSWKWLSLIIWIRFALSSFNLVISFFRLFNSLNRMVIWLGFGCFSVYSVLISFIIDSLGKVGLKLLTVTLSRPSMMFFLIEWTALVLIWLHFLISFNIYSSLFLRFRLVFNDSLSWGILLSVTTGVLWRLPLDCFNLSAIFLNNLAFDSLWFKFAKELPRFKEDRLLESDEWHLLKDNLVSVWFNFSKLWDSRSASLATVTLLNSIYLSDSLSCFTIIN